MKPDPDDLLEQMMRRVYGERQYHWIQVLRAAMPIIVIAAAALTLIGWRLS